MYKIFQESKPIADNAGQSFVETCEENLQALRDIIVSGSAVNWNYENGAYYGSGTYSQPSWMRWVNNETNERLTALITWGTYGPTAINYYWRKINPTTTSRLIGTESIQWSGANCTGTTWSGTAEVSIFEAGKPITGTDSALQTIDYIRENLMAIRDDFVMGAGFNFNYDPNNGTGTAEQPQDLYYKNGDFWIRGTVTYSSNLVQSILWRFRTTSGGAYTTIGTETFQYNAEDVCDSIVWSGTNSYTNFENNKPVLSEANANNIIVDVKNNLHALRDSAVFIGVTNWNYSITIGAYSAANPQYLFYKNGTNWIRVQRMYGTSGAELNCVTKEIISYSENSGSNYEDVGTINFTYVEAGIVAFATWA